MPSLGKLSDGAQQFSIAEQMPYSDVAYQARVQEMASNAFQNLQKLRAMKADYLVAAALKHIANGLATTRRRQALGEGDDLLAKHQRQFGWCRVCGAGRDDVKHLSECIAIKARFNFS